MRRRLPGILAIAVLVPAGALAGTGCGNGASSTATLTSAPSSSIKQVVDQHPDVAGIVCRDTGKGGRSVKVEAVDGYVWPLSEDAHVSPSKLLDEFESHC